MHQGNVITKEMVDQLRIGMTRDQVRFMLGTPLMTSDLPQGPLDYIYYLNPLKGPVQNRRLTGVLSRTTDSTASMSDRCPTRMRRMR